MQNSYDNWEEEKLFVVEKTRSSLTLEALMGFRHCCGLNVCSFQPPTFSCWSLNTNIMVLGGPLIVIRFSRLGEKGEAVLKESVPLEKEEELWALSTLEEAARRQPPAGQGEESQWGTESIGTLILDSPDSRTARSRCLLLKPSSPSFFCFRCPI